MLTSAVSVSNIIIKVAFQNETNCIEIEKRSEYTSIRTVCRVGKELQLDFRSDSSSPFRYVSVNNPTAYSFFFTRFEGICDFVPADNTLTLQRDE